MAREKKKVIVGVSQTLAEDAFAVFADAYNDITKIEAKMNAELNAIRDKYQERITKLEEVKEAQKDILQVFATEHKSEWKNKSIEMLHGKLGFRTGTPKLKCDKGFNWTSVTELLNEYFPDYVRVVNEPNKEKLIADRDEEGFDKICKKAHIAVVQEETFFVEPKVEELQTA
jgi:phage host-nuclease inhibitor protein Gam